MKTVEDIEQDIQQLPEPDIARLTAWLNEYDAELWDRKMEEDSSSGKLDFLFEEAKTERASGKLRAWPPEEK